MGSNESTANTAAVGAALGGLVFWALGLLLPVGAVETLPQGALTCVVTWAFCRFVPSGTDIVRSVTGISVAIALVVLSQIGCSAITPTIAVNADGSWTFSAGQYALVDRLPSDDQQAETSTITGLSARDLSIGVAQRDVLRNPVDTERLYGVGFAREQKVTTGLGDSLDSDYASGAAFVEEAEDGDTTATE